ncbi:MAG: hypothetical protein H6726_01195 [Sandaracinaceae bacterium]|nr:hypothetical protein [Sandaracinaceae bacterium]
MRVPLCWCVLCLALTVAGCGDDPSEPEGTASAPESPAPEAPRPDPEPSERAPDRPVDAPAAPAAPDAPAEPTGADADAPPGTAAGNSPEATPGGATPADTSGNPSTTAVTSTADATEPPGACTRVSRAPLEVMPERGAPGLAAHGSSLLVAGYRHEGEREWVQVMSVEGGRAQTEAELPVVPPLTQSRHAAPAVLFAGGRTVVAYTDGRGRLFVATPGQAPTQVTELADIRLSPTLATVAGGVAVTFTDSSGPTPRAILVRLGGDLQRVAQHVLHPDYMGGTAPFLVREPDGSAHRVAFADPRRGLSSLLLAELDPQGAPRGEPRTVSVVSQLSDPARVVMVDAHEASRLHIGFTAVDARGATAVGHLFSDGPSNPRPLIPNRGYGILDLDGLGLPHGALFVVDSPLGDPDTSPRELVVRQVNANQFGEPLTVRSPDGTARAGRLARVADGTVMVAYTGLHALFVEALRCPDLATP